ncbi:MAG: DMT family transporter [Actinomycetota bacterium]|nr:DMT family transporter [Actinomycetota bacterium]
MKPDNRATAALVVAAFMFGSTFLVVQDATEKASVFAFLAVRFLCGSAILWPIARSRPAAAHEIGHGVAAGSCLLVGFVLQTVGLRSTSSSTSAFITYLLVVLVPLITSLIDRTWPARSVVVGVALAVAGLVLLSGGISGFGLGELLTLGCALAFALHIVVLGRTAERHDAIRLTFWQTLTVGVACVVPGLFTGGYRFGGGTWLAAAFCGLGATAVAFSCMVWAQRVVTEARAAIVLLLEPVFAACIGYVAGERLGVGGLLGAVLILIAVVVTELAPRRAARLVT